MLFFPFPHPLFCLNAALCILFLHCDMLSLYVCSLSIFSALTNTLLTSHDIISTYFISLSVFLSQTSSFTLSFILLLIPSLRLSLSLLDSLFLPSSLSLSIPPFPLPVWHPSHPLYFPSFLQCSTSPLSFLSFWFHLFFSRSFPLASKSFPRRA